MTRRLWATWLGISMLVFALDVRAQNKTPTDAEIEEGRRHFKSGVDFYRDGDLNAAQIEFKRAYEAAPNYRLLYNLGQASYALRHYVDAQRYFRRYLLEGGSEIEPARRKEAEELLEKLAGRIATIVLSCNIAGADLFVDDVPVGKSPLNGPVTVSAGKRRISAVLEGRPRLTREVEAAGGDKLVEALDFGPAPPRDSPQPLAAAASGSGPGAAVWLGIGAGALAVGAGVMALLAENDASDYREKLGQMTTEQELNGLHDRAVAKAMVTDILLGAAGVTAVITLIVALSEGEAPERAMTAEGPGRIGLVVTPRAVALTGHFE